MAFDNSGTNTLSSPENPKKVRSTTFLAAIGQAVCRWKALNVGSSKMQFQQDRPKDTKITALSIFWRKTKKNFSRLRNMVGL